MTAMASLLGKNGIEESHRAKHATLGRVKADTGSQKFREEVGQGRLLGDKGATARPKGREGVEESRVSMATGEVVGLRRALWETIAE